MRPGAEVIILDPGRRVMQHAQFRIVFIREIIVQPVRRHAQRDGECRYKPLSQRVQGVEVFHHAFAEPRQVFRPVIAAAQGRSVDDIGMVRSPVMGHEIGLVLVRFRCLMHGGMPLHAGVDRQISDVMGILRNFLFFRQRQGMEAPGLREGVVDQVTGHPVVADIEKPGRLAGVTDVFGKPGHGAVVAA